MVRNSGLDNGKAEESAAVWAHLQYERLVKTVMLGMVEGDQPRGRPAGRWSDDITLQEAVQLALYNGEELLKNH